MEHKTIVEDDTVKSGAASVTVIGHRWHVDS
jgi:hypothetical protein